MAGYTRKDLKKDQVAEQMKHGFDFLNMHRDEAKRYGAIALAVILIGAGVYFYMHYQAGVRADALSHALLIDNALVGNTNQIQPGALHYATQAEKDVARAKAFSELAAKYHGSQEGAIALFYLASDAVDKGDLAGAEKRYKDVIDSAPEAYSSLARISLGKVLVAEGKYPEAEKVLKDAVDHPSVSVSKEEATIQLALVVGKTRPDDARKMLEPLRTARTAISRAAVQALGDVQNITQ